MNLNLNLQVAWLCFSHLHWAGNDDLNIILLSFILTSEMAL